MTRDYCSRIEAAFAKRLCAKKPWLRFLVLIVALFTTIGAFAADRVTFIHTDLYGSPVAATNDSAEVVWSRHYTPYGEEVLQNDFPRDSVGYTGHLFDNQTNLSYFQARTYDPAVGRFMGIDPVGLDDADPHSFNRYAYVNNNPYRYTDPDGRQEKGLFRSTWGSTATTPRGSPINPRSGSPVPGMEAQVRAKGIESYRAKVTKGAKNASGNLDDAARVARTQPHQREVTQHANQRLQTRDKRVTNKAMETAITHGQRNLDPSTGKTVHNLPASQSPTGRGVTTVTNPRGGVITVIDKGRKFGP